MPAIDSYTALIADLVKVRGDEGWQILYRGLALVQHYNPAQVENYKTLILPGAQDCSVRKARGFFEGLIETHQRS